MSDPTLSSHLGLSGAVVGLLDGVDHLITKYSCCPYRVFAIESFPDYSKGHIRRMPKASSGGM
jgi:hypothetical protein